MDVILLEKIENLGDLGDKVTVKPGYARNHLIPKAKAKYATEENLKEFEAKREELEKVAKENLEIAQKVIDVAADSDMTPAQLAINWQRAQSPNISCLFGARSAAQCEENMQSLNYEITDEQLIALNETTQIDMGFPRDFLDTDRVRHIVYGGHYGDIEI